jgi:DNA-binding PucR family transcriptional regulator
MAITIRDVLSLPGLGLKVVAGNDGIDRPIRWAHTSELQDPTPWLKGGELLLTTGMGLKGSPSLQRAYIRRLVEADLAGLGFGVGFDFEEVPPAILKTADRDGFPILEVPYPVPFLAIAEAISSRLAEDRLKDAQLSVEVHERLASLVGGGAGPADVLDEVVALAGGWVVLFDLRGGVLAAASSPGASPPEHHTLWAGLPQGLKSRTGPTTTSEVGPRGTTLGVAVMSGKRHEGILAFGQTRKLQPRERLVVHHAVTVLGLLLASRRAVIEAERRVAGDVLSEAFAGRLNGAELERRLELAGFSPGASLTVMIIEGEAPAPDGAGSIPLEHDASVLDELAWTVDTALGARSSGVRTTVTGERVAAVVADADARSLAQGLMDEFEGDETVGSLRIGLGEAVPLANLRQSYLTGLFALRAAAGASVASPSDLGSYGLLLGGQPRPALEGFVRAVLGPLMDRDRVRSSELVASVRAFVEAGGRWEPGAESLGVHRHTLRYRIRQAEELLGRDLSSTEDQLEVWLALKASDILAE